MQQIQIFSFLILIISVVIHEVSHGYAAYLQGDPTAYYEGRLTLNPLKHIDIMGSIIVPIITTIGGFPFGWAKPVPFNLHNLRNQRWGELLVAIAGPGSNILIALIFGTIIRFGGLHLPAAFLNLSVIVIMVNLSLAIFNMMPFPPLDGSKVLFAFLPFKFQHYRRQIEQYSIYLILGFVLIISQSAWFGIFFGNILGFMFTLISGVPHSKIGL